jgi:probable rRNA maturation factor
MSLPQLQLHQHHPSQPDHTPLWSALAVKALPLCLAETKGECPPLTSLEEIEVSLVSDEVISQVHGDFLQDPTPTDVITFHHGEILISLDTAARQAAELSQPYEREVALYLIHGLLHLAGWHDADETERAEMHRLQEIILDRIYKMDEGLT